MNKLILLLISGVCVLMAAEYMNVETGSGWRYTELSNLTQITFNEAGTEINFVLSGSTVTESISDIVKIEFAELQEGDVALPVELMRFTATRQAGQVILYWETGSETENLGFYVERKQNNESAWETLGFVQGKGSTTALSAYRFTDKNSPDPAASRYRLKQTDYSGSFEYSPEITVADENLISSNTFRLLPNYPNPFNPVTTISYELTEKNLTTLSVYDLQGREITRLVNDTQNAGLYQVSFDGSAISSGVYICRLVSGADTQIIKMLLLR
ncbi:MAG: T9SS type A sorting domain-containing protein [Candidatus Neomarinimicrobiota bacterium]|jgi:hypothetical protein|nr:T9SS type A sorting domain-containing protein [Candidatus Neomarinimicrobiota bacterium]MDD4962214.1 T9SS type A sorting domain-containing protein [Candidatus Neomarinimicrobiota bacterium]MDX9780411.1 T9SS type A sorting domain-containing protein [bacterium]